MASVQVGGTTISAYANELGVFQLNGIPEGTYTVTLTSEIDSGKEIKTITDVVVSNGAIINIGNVVLEDTPI